MPQLVLEEAALEQLTEDLGGDKEPVRDLIQSFLTEAPLGVGKLRAAVGRGSAADLASAAHSLKSSSAVLGARSMAALALELETLGRDGRLAHAAPKVDAMANLYLDVERALRAWLGRA